MEKTWQLYINGHWVSAQADVCRESGDPRRHCAGARWRPAEAHAAVEAAAAGACRTGRGCPGENEASSSLMRIS